MKTPKTFPKLWLTDWKFELCCFYFFFSWWLKANSFTTQFKTVYRQCLHSLRPRISRPCLLYILWKLFPNYYKPIGNSSYALTLTFSLFLSTFFSVMMKANSFTMWMNVCLAENSIRILSLNSLWAYFFSLTTFKYERKLHLP